MATLPKLLAWVRLAARRGARERLRLGTTPAVVASVYAALGIAASGAENYEVFPFFSWFLFPITPAEVLRYEVHTSCPRTDIARSHPMDLEVVVQSLGKAVEAGDGEKTRRYRRLLEKNFLVPRCRYDLMRSVYDPLQRWRGNAATQTTIASFDSSRAP